MRAGRRPSSPARGFTFIELLVVIAILALLASIVVANLDGMSAPTKLRGAARAMGNQMLQLKEMAAIQGRPLSMEIDVEHNRSRIIAVPSENDVPDAKERENQTIYGDWDESPLGVQIVDISFSSTDVERGSSTIVTFEADGEVSPSGFVVFFRHESLPDEEGVSVEVSGLTGLVAYHDGKIKAEEIRRAEDF